MKSLDGTIYANGTCSLYSLELALDCDIDLTEGEEDIDTLAGLIIHRAGVVPKQGDKISFNGFEATVEEVTGASIGKIRILQNRKNN